MNYNYNEISKIYDAVREADLKAVKFMIEKAQLSKESRVLEIGCGTANYLKIIYDITKPEVWGLDRSKGMLSRAREKCKDAVLVEGDAIELLEIPDSAFDLVYMVDVIHHIKDIEKMFKNIKRVLKENGKLVVFSDDHEHIRNRLTTKYFPETLEGELRRYQDTPEIKDALLRNYYNEIDNGILEIGEDLDYGSRLIEIASKKGYSMFGMISEGAIEAGIERIKSDMLKHPVVYKQRAPYVIAVK
ncbi:class I SAM-dependent methyltransferase [Wukongibacter baidiensis]|uniref:class I SAM-dependent methyltransferase n=1 Tax=Wukongibacter baidiensis TaxID=1723361 RepID=UPI003D7FEF6D